MSAPEPQIDFTQIDFPTDRLTVKDLRRLYPEAFDRPPASANLADRDHPYLRRGLDDILGSLIDIEREHAELAFYKALGRPRPGHLGPEHETIECLANGYVKQGLASGEHHAHELIRAIESQATAQAQRHLGPTR